MSANRRFYDSIRLAYSKTETVDSIDEIDHRIFREALRFSNIRQGIELTSVADVPSQYSSGASSTNPSFPSMVESPQVAVATSGEFASGDRCADVVMPAAAAGADDYRCDHKNADSGQDDGTPKMTIAGVSRDELLPRISR